MVSTKKFSEFDSGGDLSNDNITVGYGSGDNKQYNNPWTFLPPGSTGERPIPDAPMYYRLRLNTTLNIYEYYEPTTLSWVQLSVSGAGTINPGVTNDIAFYASDGQSISPISGAANSVLVTNGTGIPSLNNTLPSGLNIPGASITSSTASLVSGSVSAAPVAGTDIVNKDYLQGFSPQKTTYIGTASYNILVTDDIILVDTDIIAAPVSIVLPAAPTNDGQTFTIKDIGLDAQAFNITISVAGGGTIGGQADYTIASDDEAVSIAWSTSQSEYYVVYSFDTLIPVLRISGNSGTAAPNIGVITINGGTTGLTTTASGSTLSLTGVLNASNGGTGVNNGSNTLTLAGNLATIGSFASTFTMTGVTNVTFPTSGTLLTSAGAVTSLAATANQTTVSAATGAVTTGLASNAILPGTGGVTLPQGNTAARAGGAGTMRFNTQSLVFESTIDGVAWATIDTAASGDVDSITGTANQVIASSPTGNVTLSLPQSIATSSAVQFASVRLSNTGILDTNNNRILSTTAIASSVNYLDIQNAATGGTPVMSVVGSDTNIPMALQGQGNSGILIKGATNGVAVAANYVGQVISSQVLFASATNINSGSATNLTSIALTPGNWLVFGNITFFASSATGLNQVNAWISSASATVPDPSLRSGIGANLTIQVTSTPTNVMIFNLGSNTTVYLSGSVGLNSGTCTQCGIIQAIRLP